MEVQSETAIKSLCRAPEIWQSITTQGEIRPCTAFRGTVGHVNQNDTKQLQQLIDTLRRGIRHPGCVECWHREELGLNSQRLHGDSWKDVSGLRILEFNLSNLCNLKCRMCLSDSSSAWIPEEILLTEDEHVGLFRQSYTQKVHSAFENDESLMNYIKKLNLRDLQKVTFKGGEPLLHSQMYTILQYLISEKKTDITISFTTNGLVIPEKLKLLKKFANVEVTISVEATGQAYKYIRGGSKYSIQDVEKNISYLTNKMNIYPIITSCIGAMNIFNLGDLYHWISINTPWAISNSYIQSYWPSVYQPDYLTVLSLDIELRKMAREINIESLDRHGLYSKYLEDTFDVFYRLGHGVTPMYEKQFIAFTKSLDKIRQEKITDAIPQFKDVYR